MTPAVTLIFDSRIPVSVALSASLFLSACGGGGSSSAGTGTTDSLPVTHGAATLQVSSTNAQHVLAHSYVALKALHSFARNFPFILQFSGASPAKPAAVYPCGIGQIDVTFTDNDHDGTVSAGDTIRYVSQTCGFPSSNDGGTVLQTVLSTDGNGISSSRLEIASNGYDELFTYGVLPKFSGTFTFARFQGSGYLLQATTEVSMQVSSSASLTLQNAAVAVLPATGYNPNAVGSMDVMLNTPLVAGLRVQVETRGHPLTLLDIENEAPTPGQLYVAGTGGTTASLQGVPDISTFRVEADTSGSGRANVSATLDAATFFSAL